MERGKIEVLFNSGLSSIAVAVALCLIPLPALMVVNQEPHFFSKYETPSIYGGLFYVVGSCDKLMRGKATSLCVGRVRLDFVDI